MCVVRASASEPGRFHSHWQSAVCSVRCALCALSTNDLGPRSAPNAQCSVHTEHALARSPKGRLCAPPLRLIYLAHSPLFAPIFLILFHSPGRPLSLARQPHTTTPTTNDHLSPSLSLFPSLLPHFLSSFSSPRNTRRLAPRLGSSPPLLSLSNSPASFSWLASLAFSRRRSSSCGQPGACTFAQPVDKGRDLNKKQRARLNSSLSRARNSHSQPAGRPLCTAFQGTLGLVCGPKVRPLARLQAARQASGQLGPLAQPEAAAEV